MHTLAYKLKLVTSKVVEWTWIRTGGYGRLRGEWVIISYMCSCEVTIVRLSLQIVSKT